MSGLAVQHSVNAGTQNTVGQDWRGLPTWFRVRNPPASKAGDLGDVGSIPVLGRCPGGGHGNPLPGFLPGESHGQRSLAGYSPWG